MPYKDRQKRLEYLKDYYQKHKKQHKEQALKRYLEIRDSKEYKEKKKLGRKKYYKKHREKICRKRREQYSKDKKYSRAYHAVYCSLRKGELIKPDKCEKCGKIGKLDAHHSDYDRLLDVEWLCRSCHRNLSRKRGILSAL